jgi:transposase InsO family protein
MVSPARRRDAVAYLVRRHKVSERRACQVVGQHRSTQRYAPRPSDFEDRLIKEMNRLAETHPRWGYRHIHGLLVADGWKVNAKRIERLWRLEGNRVPPAKSKKSGKRAGGSAENSIWNFPAVHVDHIWTIDFIEDRTVRGVKFRSFNILDEYSRYFIGAHVARSIGSRSVQAFFAELFATEGRPKFLRADNGREFIGAELAKWLTEQGVTILFIEKASPQQNGFVERFHRSMRSEVLNVEEFDSVLEARVVIGEWRELYNNVRRHRGLRMQTPAAFRAEAKKQLALDRTRQTDGGRKERGR